MAIGNIPLSGNLTPGVSLDVKIPGAEKAAGPSSSKFDEALSRVGAAMTQQDAAASAAVEQFVSGTAGGVHEPIIALDKADISMKFMVSVRNRLMEAYREVMRSGS